MVGDKFFLVEEAKRFCKIFGVKHDEIGMDEEKMDLYITKDGVTRITGLGSVTTYIASQSNTGTKLLGQNMAEEVLISQWLEYRTSQIDRCSNPLELEANLNIINQYLSNKTYFVGNRITLADVILYSGLHTVFKNLNFQEKESLIHLSRWFDLVQHSSLLSNQLEKVIFSKTLLYGGCNKKH